jgi:hypothetical protein
MAYPASTIVAGTDAQFDALLISTCAIAQRPVTPADDYGQRPAPTVDNLFVLLDDIPCRVSRMDGREIKLLQQAGITGRKVYMRPVLLTERIPGVGESYQQVALSNRFFIIFEGRLFNILDVQNPSELNHHLEIVIEEVTP